MEMNSSKRKVFEYLNTFRPIKTRLVDCSLGSTKFKFFVSRHDDLYKFTAQNRFIEYENGSLVYWQKNCENSIVIDIGAYTGIYTIVAHFSKANYIFSFEPNKSSRSQLVRNLNANRIFNVNINTNALSDSNGTDYLMLPKIKFHLKPRTHGSGAQLRESKITRDKTKWKKGFQVNVSTLDEQIPKDLHSSISIIKMDIEGNELPALHGAISILKKSNAKLIIESLERDKTDAIASFLGKFSYKLIGYRSKNLIFEKN